MLRVHTRLVPPELLAGWLTLFRLWPCCGTVHTYMSEGHIHPALATEITRLAEQISVSANLVALTKPRTTPALNVRYHRVRNLPEGKIAVAEVDAATDTAHFRVAADMITKEMADALAVHATRVCHQLAPAHKLAPELQ